MMATEALPAICLKQPQEPEGREPQTLRIEKGLATLTQNQESLERIMEQKFYVLDVKVTEFQSVVEQLQDDMQERKGKTTTDAFARVPRAQRSTAVPVTDTRATSSTPATAPVQPAPAPTPPAPSTSTEVFVQGAISTPPPEDQA